MKQNHYHFKPMFWAYTFFVTPFSLFEGTLALLNINPVTFIDKPRYGIVGFIIPLIYIPVLSFLIAALNWVILNIGSYIFTLISNAFVKKST